MTKKISLFYKITQQGVTDPPAASKVRKDEWLKVISRSIRKKDESRIVKVTYELFNPEIQRMQKFFNGPVVDYYAIQSQDIMTGEVARITHDMVRETLLSDVLGYEVQLVDRKERRRKSTSDFISTQKWYDFLEMLRETIFEPNGYEMPDSEAFWDLSKKHGYEQAKTISLEQLQSRIRSKLSPNHG